MYSYLARACLAYYYLGTRIVDTDPHIPIRSFIPRNPPLIRGKQRDTLGKLKEGALSNKAHGLRGAQHNMGRALALPELLAVKTVPY